MLGAGLGAPGRPRGGPGPAITYHSALWPPFRSPGGTPARSSWPPVGAQSWAWGWDGAGELPLGQRPWTRAACLLPRSSARPAAMKIAVIGQSLFGQEVYCRLREEGHEVGVFTVPDKDGKADPRGVVPGGRRWQRACGSCGSCMSFPGLKRLHMSTLGPAQGLLTATLSGTKWIAGRWWRRLACTQDPTVQTPQASLSPHPGSKRAAGGNHRGQVLGRERALHPALRREHLLSRGPAPPRPAPEFLPPGWDGAWVCMSNKLPGTHPFSRRNMV